MIVFSGLVEAACVLGIDREAVAPVWGSCVGAPVPTNINHAHDYPDKTTEPLSLGLKFET